MTDEERKQIAQAVDAEWRARIKAWIEEERATFDSPDYASQWTALAVLDRLLARVEKP